MVGLFPVVSLSPISLEEANNCLSKWEHKMGPLNRPQFEEDQCFGLIGDRGLHGVITQSQLISKNVAGRTDLTRANTCEVSRLCAARPHICRAVLRLWREFVFPDSGYQFVISYQDADLHNGNTYRFDGWKKIGESRSGPDRRSGRKGRNKVIWMWSLER